MNKGDIVLFPFPFTDLSGSRNRPAVILIVTEEDVTIAFITTQLKWNSEFDLALKPSELNGLKKVSLLRLNKIATLDKELVIGLLGSLDDAQIKKLNANLFGILQLDQSNDIPLSEEYFNSLV